LEFYQETHPENDEQVYSLTATHVPAESRIIVTWSRPQDDAAKVHEVRFAFENIHGLGWERAHAAPGGLVKPRRDGRTMIFDSAELPLNDGKVLYLAIKPEKAKLFSQVAIPLAR
ncbi:MAG: hypothetical protein AB7K24_34955, partial [Gemmataceae bacterium]